jgi:hypothetical protein
MTSTPSELVVDDVEEKAERISGEDQSVEERRIEAQAPTTTLPQHSHSVSSLISTNNASDNAQDTEYHIRSLSPHASGSSEGQSTTQAKSNSHPQQKPEEVTNSFSVEMPSSAILSTTRSSSSLSAISIVDQMESALKSSSTEDMESNHNLSTSAEATTTASPTSHPHHQGEQQQQQEDDNLRQALSSSSTLSRNSAAVVLPSTTKDSGDASIMSLTDLGTCTTTLDSIQEQPMLDVDQCLVELLVEADHDVFLKKAVTERSEERQQQVDDMSSNGNLNNNHLWNEALTVEDLTEEEELKVARSASTSVDTDNDSTLPPRDSSSSNTVQTADEACTDTTYDTDGSLSTASAVDVDLLIEEQYHMVGPLMVGHGDDDYGSEDIMDDDDVHQHPLMPQQPELLMAAALTVDSVPTNSGEEEKAEVDEYPISEDSKDETGSIEELVMLPEPPDLEPPVVSERRIRFEDDADVPPIIDNNRAEYVSATIIKREASQEHGLVFRMVDRELRLSSISKTGLFADSPLAPFDRMLRLNDLNVETLDPVNASHLLDALTGAITIIAQNQGGVKDLVESLITKPNVESVTGIEFTAVCTDDALMKQNLEISRIGQKSLFSLSLLHVGDRVISVNGCEDLDINTAPVLLSSAKDHCVVLARTKLKTKMAIARRPTHQLPPNFNFVRAMEEARRHREELRRKQGCYYNSCERPGAFANFFQWLGNIYVITIVIVGVSISWNTLKQHTHDSNSVTTILKFMALFVGGLLVGFLVNAPWWFRQVGARFSVAQLLCNVVVSVSFFLVAKVFDNAELSAHRKDLFFGLFFPLLIIVNLPSVFVKMEDGSDGNTISDHGDDSSTNSDLSDVV